MPGERDLPDHKKSLTLSGEVRTYRNGRAVIFVRLGMIEPECDLRDLDIIE